MDDHPLPQTPSALEANRLIEAGPGGWRLGRLGDRGRAVGRLIGRLARGGVPYQQAVDRSLLDSVGHVDRRVDTLVARLDASDRAHAALLDRLQSDEAFADDLVLAIEALRASIAEQGPDAAPLPRAGEARELPSLADVVAASRVRPYVEPAFETWDEPHAGKVMGFTHPQRAGAGAEQRYKLFEDRFRGSEQRVLELQRPYLDVLDGHAPVLDLGCGRGEMLDLLRERGIAHHGVDVDAAMIARCREKGHTDVEVAGASAHLASVPDGHYGAIFCAQVIEHLPYAELDGLLRLAASKLRPGGLFIAETVNPHAPAALRMFWTDLTHQHPIYPEVALSLCELTGFASAYVFHPMGSGTVDRDSWTQGAYAVVARAADTSADGG